ncbi:type I-E CRISPR-associated endonuclease Cas1e [Desulfohalovibrio reitneri]|uniref:type I-E CRISPR-associated endonuclease Cas1e n=1 Tax=Desulfohalovibrio reitneri TaxID=1307759 RepID=UPI0004A6C80F|nr:type I-E CRISPR-associated endonuclease Cas1e [Desulfohalovibrio reitneri]
MLPKLSPLPLKERFSLLFLEKGRLDVKDGAFVLIDKEGVRTHIPVGGVACLMLEPGSRVSHAAAVLAARAGTLLVWTGEAGVRLYSAGQPGGARSDKLLYQASLALDPEARLKVVRAMFAMRFGEPPPARRSVEQLRGLEGARVRALYENLAKQFGVKWTRRNYDPTAWNSGDVVNRCLSSATSCLYGLSEAAVLAAGYAPAIGFLHTGKPRSFVFDIADLFKFETVVPEAFRIAARKPHDPEGQTRRACRDSFRKKKLLKRIIPAIEDILAAGGKKPPPEYEDAVKPAYQDPEGLGDAGHRG